jgi:hypothetical protein
LQDLGFLERIEIKTKRPGAGSAVFDGHEIIKRGKGYSVPTIKGIKKNRGRIMFYFYLSDIQRRRLGGDIYGDNLLCLEGGKA